RQRTGRARSCGVQPTPGPGARYARGVIWEPFLLALFLGLIVSAGLYFAYLWPSVEPSDPEPAMAGADSPATASPASASQPAEEEPEAPPREAAAAKAEAKAAAKAE